MRRHKTAFSLIEILVVISIIAVLIAILLPALSAARAAARDGTCRSNLQQWGIALGSFKLENDGFLPKPQNEVGASPVDDPNPLIWYNALPDLIDAGRYTDIYDGSSTDQYSNSNIWWCPEARAEFGPPGFTGSGNSFDYAFNTVLNGTASYTPNPPSGSGQPQIASDVITNPSEVMAMSEPRARVPYLTITTSNFGGVDENRHSGTNANMMFIDSHVESVNGADAQVVYSGPNQSIDTDYWTTNEGDVVWGSFYR